MNRFQLDVKKRCIEKLAWASRITNNPVLQEMLRGGVAGGLAGAALDYLNPESNWNSMGRAAMHGALLGGLGSGAWKGLHGNNSQVQPSVSNTSNKAVQQLPQGHNNEGYLIGGLLGASSGMNNLSDTEIQRRDMLRNTQRG